MIVRSDLGPRTALRPLFLGFLLAAVAAGCGKGVTKPAPLPPLSRVVISEGSDTTVVADTLQVGGSLQFGATAYDQSGAPLANPPFSWTSTAPAVCTVISSGRATGVGEGEAQLIVSLGDKSDSVRVLVLPSVSGWFAQVSNSGGQLNGVYFDPDGRHGWAVGNVGEIRATTDAGENWARQVSNTLFDLNAVWFTDADSGWAVGDNGTILGTVDRGQNWVLQPAVTAQSLRGVWTLGEFVAFAAGQQGVVPRVQKVLNAPVWELQNSGATNQLEGVFAVSDSIAFAVGFNGSGLMLRSDDAGVTWPTQSVPVSGRLRDVFFIDKLRGWAVGDNGRILHTGNGGQP